MLSRHPGGGSRRALREVATTVRTESLDSKLISTLEPSSIINVKRTSKVDAGAKVSICSAALPAQRDGRGESRASRRSATEQLAMLTSRQPQQERP